MQKVKFTVKAGGKGSRGRSNPVGRPGKLTGAKRAAPNLQSEDDCIPPRRVQRVNYNEDDESGEGQSSASQKGLGLGMSKKPASETGSPRFEMTGAGRGIGSYAGSAQKQDSNDLPTLLKQSHPLQRCLLILDNILASGDAQALAQAPRGNSPISLEGIRASLAPGLEHGWGMVKYKSTAEVLREIAYVLKSILIANKSHRQYSVACNKIFGEVRRWWQFAGLHQDLNQLRASVGVAASSNSSSSSARNLVPKAQGKEPSRPATGVSSQHASKMRKIREVNDSQHHESSAGGNTNLDKIREEVQKAREELDAITIQKAKALQELHEKDRWSQAKAAEIQKQYNAASKQMEKVAGAQEMAKVLREAALSNNIIGKTAIQPDLAWLLTRSSFYAGNSH